MEGRDTKLMINIHMFDSITLNNKHGGSGTNYVRFRFSADSIMPKEKTVTIRNAKSENSMRYINRYLSALKFPPTKLLIDSLLLTYGFGPTRNLVFKKSSDCVQPAIFSVRGNVLCLHVHRFTAELLGFCAIRSVKLDVRTVYEHGTLDIDPFVRGKLRRELNSPVGFDEHFP